MGPENSFDLYDHSNYRSSNYMSSTVDEEMFSEQRNSYQIT